MYNESQVRGWLLNKEIKNKVKIENRLMNEI